MKQKLYPLLTTFLLMSFFSISQSPAVDQSKDGFQQTGIKKKVADLLSLPKTTKAASTPRVIPLRSFFKPNSSITKTRVNHNILETALPDGEEAGRDGEGQAKAMRSPSLPSSTTTQQAWSNFLATDFYENPIAWPPDPNGDVGSSQVIACSNLGIKVFDKRAVTDAPLVTPTGYSRDIAQSTLFLTLYQLFAPVISEQSYISDPHIRYDRLTKRWFIIAIDAQSDSLLLAVSDGDKVTASSSFTYFSFDAGRFPHNKNTTAILFDYPTLGVDKNSILVGGNAFMYNSSFTALDSLNEVGYVIDKTQLLHGKLVAKGFKLGFANFATGEASGLYVPQGVQNDDPAAKKSFFAGISFYFDGLILANIEYDKNKRPKLAAETSVKTEPWNSPRNNTAPGGFTAIDLLDTRLFAAAIYKNKLTGNSSLWTAHAIGVDQSGKFINGSDSDFVRTARTGSRWYKIGNIYKKPGVIQSGTIYDAKEPSGRRAKQYFNPSVAASGQGHSIVNGTTDAFNEYLNVFAAGRYLGDQLGETKPPVKITNTTAIYSPYRLSGGTREYIGRWGDFSQTVVDPLDDQTIWTFQEYANVDDSYGVRVVQFKAPPPATPAAIGTISNKTDTTVTLTGESINNSGFFDPGPDWNGPGYNRLSVKSTGNVLVSNVKFITPTKISFKLNTKNQAAGQYILLITNPDGQFVVTTYTIASGTTTTLIAGNNSAAERAKIAQSYITGSEVYPNPTTGNVTLQINAAKEQIAKIVLIDVKGNKVFEKDYSFSKGTNQGLLPTQNLTRGTYIAVVYNADNVLLATQKIVRQ